MKALGLVRISKKKNFVIRILGATIWVEKSRESFSMLLFCKYVNFLVKISIVHGKLKPCKILSCVKFMCKNFP